jgi:hypothetical protein
LRKTFVQKAARKILVKLTPDGLDVVGAEFDGVVENSDFLSDKKKEKVLLGDGPHPPEVNFNHHMFVKSSRKIDRFKSFNLETDLLSVINNGMLKTFLPA